LAWVSLVSCNLVLLLRVWYPPRVHAQKLPTIQQLFGFGCDPKTNVCADGKNPNSLLQSADANFYGTTFAGGLGDRASGTVFKVTSAGQLTVIYTFVADQNGNYPNGEFPTSLVEGNDGFLYGTAGVVFKLSKAGAIHVLHNLCFSCGEGANPSNLMLGQDGNFYGFSLGRVFRITPGGSFTVLHTFNSQTEGPTGLGLTQASNGNLYGTTVGGQTIFTTLFRLTPAGQFTILHTFHYADFPTSAPVQGSDGKLYGISRRGLFYSGLNGSGFQELTLPPPVLQYVTQASDLNLWSTIYYDSNYLNGAIRTVSTQGLVLQTIAFDGTNGAGPNGPVVQGSDGKILGVTYTGGSVPQGEAANGVVFTLDADLAAPNPAIVSFNPNSGKVGSKVTIHGAHFIGATEVRFDGVSATFQVLNTGNILATVPIGAASGPIAVTNPGGTATSRENFTVQ